MMLIRGWATLRARDRASTSLPLA